MIKSFLLCLVCALSCIFCQKNIAPLTGGSASEGEAKIVGSMVYPGGKAAKNAIVRLRSAEYLQDITKKSLAKSTVRYANLSTDSTGCFTVNGVDTGNYTIEVNDNNSHAVFIRCRVQTDSVLLIDTLKSTGSISGAWHPLVSDTLSGFVQVYGLERSAKIDSLTNKFTLSDIPAGTFTVRFVSASTEIEPCIIDSVVVAVGAYVVQPFLPLQFSKKLYLNTTITGATVLGVTTNFPVLVRLIMGQFRFDQAQKDGSDIRFTKADGSLLSYEIEQWDPSAQQAEIWVNVDTILGNTSNQFITMHWGSPAGSVVQSLSNSSSVFDTANGFAGVWHLGEDAVGITQKGVYKNAVQNANFGDDDIAATGKQGIIGLGQPFDKGDKIVVTNATAILRPQTFFMSAWFNCTGADQRTSDIASIGDNCILRILPISGWPQVLLYSVKDSVKIECQDSLINVIDSTWHHIAGSYDGQALRLYVDGVMRKTVFYSAGIVYDGSKNFVIGNHGNNLKGYSFMGAIDEVECSAKVRDDDWVKLMYESQKTNSKLVQ